jgi:hypothetical protein
MSWVINLIIYENEILEKRLERITTYIFEQEEGSDCYLADINATGPIGNQLTHRWNQEHGFKIDRNALMNAITEDGQIIELNILVNRVRKFKIIVRDGFYVDIIGEGELIPQDITGNFQRIDEDYGYDIKL